MTSSAAPISLAGSQPDEAGHVSAFNSDDEEYRVLLPFIKDRFECGDRAVQVRDLEKSQDYLRPLDARASSSLNELSYEYTDHILGSSPRPESLKDAIAQMEMRT